MKRFLSILVFSLGLYGTEPVLGVLKVIHSDEYQTFTLGNAKLTCSPYGAVSLYAVYRSEGLNETCRAQIETYYRKNPLDRHFAKLHFHLLHHYHLEMKADECIIYSQATQSYAEALLEAGLALIPSDFRDELWDFRLDRSQRRAQALRKGIWSVSELYSCVANSSRLGGARKVR